MVIVAPNELLSARETAMVMNFTARTIRNWVDSGRLRGFKALGTEYRIPAEAVLAACGDDETVRKRLEDVLAGRSQHISRRGRPRKTESPT